MLIFKSIVVCLFFPYVRLMNYKIWLPQFLKTSLYGKNCKSFFLQMLSKDGNWVSSLAQIASYPLSVKVRKWVHKWTNTWAMWSKPSENPFHTSFTLMFRTLSLTSQGIKFWRKNVSLQFWLFSNLFFFPCICFIFFFSFFFWHHVSSEITGHANSFPFAALAEWGLRAITTEFLDCKGQTQILGGKLIEKQPLTEGHEAQ